MRNSLKYSKIRPRHLRARGRSGGRSSHSSGGGGGGGGGRSFRRSYTRVTYSRYYYSGYKPSPTFSTYTTFMNHPSTYWAVYKNRGNWGASCESGLHCRSGCCSSQKLSSYTVSSLPAAATGPFCLNYAAACGFGDPSG